MEYVTIVITIALLEYMGFGAMVAKARGTYGVKAPATTGNEIFERYFRVQMNSLESLIIFIPAMVAPATFTRKPRRPSVSSMSLAASFISRLTSEIRAPALLAPCSLPCRTSFSCWVVR